MLRNLQIEWMKIKNYRVFQVFSILYALGIILIIYIFYRVYISIISTLQETMTGVRSEGRDVLGIFSGDNLPYTVCFWTSLLLYLPGMVIINLFVNEVNFKTHRQNIIDGWKRETFIYTKIGLIAFTSAVITLMNFIAIVIMSQIVSVPMTSEVVKVLGLCFLQAFVYLSFALLLATFFRRSGVAIIVFFIYGLVLEWLLFWLVRYIHPSVSYFLPLQVADSLIPFSRFKDLYKDMPAAIIMVISALTYAVLYVSLTVRKYKYDDL
jgi:ABC-2 type transport system permease protein